MFRKFSSLRLNHWRNVKFVTNHHIKVHQNYARISSSTAAKKSEQINNNKEIVVKPVPNNEKNSLLSISQKFNQNPYVRLARMDKPIGTWLLYWPCGWSIALASAPGNLPDLKTLAIFGIGSFVMRGAGCTINDMNDSKLDAKVERTANRPLVTGEVDIFDAWFFLGAQLGVGMLILIELNNYCLVLGLSSLLLVTMYPLMKRITYWPQFVLGMAFNWGALMGYAAVHGNVMWEACLPLYTAGVCWTIVYDTIYAHQDREDDLKAGIKSTAIRFGDQTKKWLTGFSALMTSGLLTTGVVCDLAWPYFASIGLVSAHVGHQVYTLNINDPKDCAKKFISNHHVGLLIFLGVLFGVLMQKPKNDTKDKTESSSVILPSLSPKQVYLENKMD